MSGVIKDNRKNYTKKFLIMKYNEDSMVLEFPTQNLNYIRISDCCEISTNSIYEELLNNQKAEIENEAIKVKDKVLTDSDKIKSKLKLLQEILNLFSQEFFSKLDLLPLLDYIEFFFNLNLISLVSLILKQLKEYLVKDKLIQASNENKSIIYLSITHTIGIIQNEVVSKRCYDNESLLIINKLMGIFNDSINILFSILIVIKRKELELFIRNIKTKYLYPNNINIGINDILYKIIYNNYFLVINIIKILIISLINNKEISNKDKIDVLRDLISENKRTIKICTHDNNDNCSFIKLSHEMFSFFDLKIYSSFLTKTYNQILLLEKDCFEKFFKILEYVVDLNSKETNEDGLFLDLNSLVSKLLPHKKLFNFYCEFNDNNKNEYINKQKDLEELNKLNNNIAKLEKEAIEYKKLIDDLKIKSILQVDKEESFKNKIAQLEKDKEQLNNKVNVFSNQSKTSKINNINNINNIMHVEQKIIESTKLDSFNYIAAGDPCFQMYIGKYTKFNPVGNIVNDSKFINISPNDKSYVHCLIKEKYINSISYCEIEEINFKSKNKSSFENVDYECYYCAFKDELNRNIVCFRVNMIDEKYIPKLYDLESHKLIQTYDESNVECEIYYYKDVLNLNDVKDYLIISNFNNTCHILQLNKKTKFFKKMKVIQSNQIDVKVIPKYNLKENLIILYDFENNSEQHVYELDSNKVEKIAELDQVSNKFYHSYYVYDKLSSKENIYLVECSFDRVRLLYIEDNIIFKTFNIIPKENDKIHNAIVIGKDNPNRLYCSGSFKIFIFNYGTQKLLITIDNIGKLMARLSLTKLLSYNCHKSNKFYVIDIKYGTVSETIEIEEKDYIFYTMNPILLNSQNTYLLLMTEANQLSFLKINK